MNEQRTKKTFVWLLIGGEGCGKTYTAKQLIKNVHKSALHIFDVNAEYHDYYPYPFDRNMENFLNKFEKMKNAVMLCEDATSFFPTRGEDSQLKDMMTARRHTGNSFILLFHSFQDVPKYILRKATDVIIFKTMDMPAYMESEYRNTIYLEAWKKVQEHSQQNKFYSAYPPPRGTVPSMTHLKLKQ